MRPNYSDITSRITDPIIWYDPDGCPRYDPFDPAQVNIYWRSALLFEIECQSCQQTFLIGQAWSDMELLEVITEDGKRHPFLSMIAESKGLQTWRRTLEEIVAAGAFGFGDAPNVGPHRGCAGATMSSDVTAVVEAWTRLQFETVRRPDLEGPVAAV